MTGDGILSGRTAIVTGASSGMGRAIALRLGEDGAHVFLAGRTCGPMEEAARKIRASGGEASVAEVDVRDPEQIHRLISSAVQATGRLNIMVNNAGVVYWGNVVDGDADQWREMLETNVLAVLVGSQAAIRAMRATKSRGHIVNISSTAADTEGHAAYGATKAAVDRISRALRLELENEPIRVVNIKPGEFATNAARYLPNEAAQILKGAGVERKYTPGEHMPDEVLERLHQALRTGLGSADDIARTVVWAVTQPIELNIFNVDIRPQKSLFKRLQEGE